MSARVKVYTTEYCPYCVRAKQLLKSRGIAFEEIRIDNDDQAWDELYARSKMRTVPQIFNGEELIGGYMELADLDARDGLKSLK